MFDWRTWAPTEVATLCFILEKRGLLLIRKKRGLGAGKVNAPGGKLEPGESAEDAAVRETREEVGVTPLKLYQAGEVFFHFTNGYNLYCHVFRANDCLGDPVETPEAVPFWISTDQVPYSEMWPDDARWLPILISGLKFRGRFVFDGDSMLSDEVRIVNELFIGRTSSPWLVF